jgi:hypothetical protein
VKGTDGKVAIGLGDSVGLSVCFVHISAIRWSIYCCQLEKEGVSKEQGALKRTDFGILFWIWVRLVTLLKFGNKGRLA